MAWKLSKAINTWRACGAVSEKAEPCFTRFACPKLSSEENKMCSLAVLENGFTVGVSFDQKHV